MEISDGVYVFPLETEYFGNDRTFYITGVETDRGLALFDVGGPDDEDVLADALADHGFSFDDVDKVVLTHHDYDHLGCLAEVVERSGAEVIAHERATRYVTGETKMLKRPEEPYPGVPVAMDLTGGERFHTDAGRVEAIFTPGHAPGHLVFYFRDAGLLVAGDILRGDSDPLGGPKRSVTPDLAETRDSLGKLLDLDLEHVLCHHGGPKEATAADIQHIYDDLVSEV